MKHSSYLYMFLTACLFIGLNGCRKYLDIKPKGVDVVTTMDEYNGLFNNSTLISYGIVIVSAGGISPGDNANLSLSLSDEVSTMAPYNSFLEPQYMNAYHWDPAIYLPDQEAAEWDAFYMQNYTYNVIANGVLGASGGTDQEKRQLLAEARANRAFLHFLLVNYFGKPYNPSTASADPGIPIVTVADAPASSGPRASVQAVYDFITSELTASLADLPDDEPNRLRLGKAAGNYMLGEVYLYMGKYDSALTALNAAENLAASNSLPMSLYDYNTTIPQWTPPIPNFPPSIPVGPNNQEAICQRQVTVGTFSGELFLDSSYASLFDSTDLRLNFLTKTDFSGTAVYPGWSRAAPYQVNYGPSMPNLYLMLAECKARTGDLAGATADLVTLRQHRMPADVANVTITGQDSLIRFIIQERYREYALTGLNWFDVRRLWNDPLFAGKTYSHTDETGSYTLTEDRLTLKIPPKILSDNPGMTDNP